MLVCYIGNTIYKLTKLFEILAHFQVRLMYQAQKLHFEMDNQGCLANKQGFTTYIGSWSTWKWCACARYRTGFCGHQLFRQLLVP